MIKLKRQAILFTAGKYPSTKNIKIDELTGVSCDIVAMDKRLTQIGFDVIKKEDAHMADYPDMLKCYSEGLATDSISNNVLPVPIQKLFEKDNRNLIGKYIKFNPIYGNAMYVEQKFIFGKDKSIFRMN